MVGGRAFQLGGEFSNLLGGPWREVGVLGGLVLGAIGGQGRDSASGWSAEMSIRARKASLPGISTMNESRAFRASCVSSWDAASVDSSIAERLPGSAKETADGSC